MEQSIPIYLAGQGMITPIGANAPMSLAGLATGTSCYEVSEYYTDKGKPVTMALVPDEALPELNRMLDLDFASKQKATLLQMCDVALQEAMAVYPGGDPLPIFFSAPVTYPDVDSGIDSDFIEHLAIQSKQPIDVGSSRIIRTGRTGVLHAIELAIKYLTSSDSDFVLVGGADCFQNKALTKFLSKDGRLLAEEVMNGFAPGEMAVFLLLTRSRNLASDDDGVIRLYSPGMSSELGHIYSEEPYRGEGLVLAVQQAIENSQCGYFESIYSSMNGESFWSKEYGVAMMRLSEYFSLDMNHIHPADCIGDTGAAVGGLLVALAGQDLINKKIEKTQLIYCSSDHEYRSAICLAYENI